MDNLYTLFYIASILVMLIMVAHAISTYFAIKEIRLHAHVIAQMPPRVSNKNWRLTLSRISMIFALAWTCALIIGVGSGGLLRYPIEVNTDYQTQIVSLFGGNVVLAPDSDMRIDASGSKLTKIELLRGSLSVEPTEDALTPWTVNVSGWELRNKPDSSTDRLGAFTVALGASEEFVSVRVHHGNIAIGGKGCKEFNLIENQLARHPSDHTELCKNWKIVGVDFDGSPTEIKTQRDPLVPAVPSGVKGGRGSGSPGATGLDTGLGPQGGVVGTGTTGGPGLSGGSGGGIIKGPDVGGLGTDTPPKDGAGDDGAPQGDDKGDSGSTDPAPGAAKTKKAKINTPSLRDTKRSL